MNRMKILLSAVLVFAATASIAQDFIDPLYAPWGDTPEQRKQNILTSNLLKEAVDTRDYDAAAVYFRTLAQEAPSAFEATFIRGAQVYSNKVQRAQDLNEKKALLDSLMMIYDLRVQYFPSSPNYGTAYVLDRKAREYLTFNPSDREGVRKLYKEAIEAGLQSGYAALPDVALVYFSNLCDDYKMGEVYPDAVLDEYARLAPIFESDAPGVKEAKTQFDTCFAGSGAADCENLEKMFRPRIEAAPEDMELLKQTVSLMSRSQCSSEFFLQIARHFVDHRAFQVDNLIVREHQNVVLGKCIGHAEGHLVMVVFAEVWIELHVIEEVMHPSHVPFVGEMQAAVLYASRYLRPRCGLLGNHDDTFVSSAHQGIQVFEELDGFEIFISAVLVPHPMARH